MKIVVTLLALCFPVVGFSEPKVLVDAVPTGGEFVGATDIQMPFTDADGQDAKMIRRGLNGAMNNLLDAATSQGYSYVCLLSAPGDRPIEIPIDAAKTNLKLSRVKTRVLALFYQGGHDATRVVAYSGKKPNTKTNHVSVTFEKIAVPPGVTTAGWVYFNLARIQEEAEKAKSPIVFLSPGGAGSDEDVPIPGLKDPLHVPAEKSTLTATWEVGPDDPALKGEVLGHSLSSDKNEKSK